MTKELIPRPLPAKARLHLAHEENASLRTRIAALEAENERMRNERDALTEAALAEKDKEIAALREERDFLQEILDTRPAINAELPESYIRWSQSLYSGEAARASLEARNEGGKGAE